MYDFNCFSANPGFMPKAKHIVVRTCAGCESAQKEVFGKKPNVRDALLHKSTEAVQVQYLIIDEIYESNTHADKKNVYRSMRILTRRDKS